MTWDELERGQILLTNFGNPVGREQGGVRPAIVVASPLYLASADRLALVVPVTSRDRNWPNHVRVTGSATGLQPESYAMCEQLRLASRDRLLRYLGSADPLTMNLIYQWLADYLDLWVSESAA